MILVLIMERQFDDQIDYILLIKAISDTGPSKFIYNKKGAKRCKVKIKKIIKIKKCTSLGTTV